jgi:spermidine synthase
MRKKIKHISSYLLPVTVERRNGDITPYLEVLLVDGKYVLDTSSVNYSYGNCQKIFQKAFSYFNLKSIEFDNVLMLGFGAGSVASILTEEYEMKCRITGVEKDGVVIDLAKQYFNIHRFKNLELVHESAYTYVEQTQNKFDLIIMDVFVDETVPKMFHEEKFLHHLNRILSSDGVLFYNFMTTPRDKKSEFEELSSRFETIFGNYFHYKVKTAGWTENTLLVYDRINRLRSTPIPDKKPKEVKKEWGISKGLSPSFG